VPPTRRYLALLTCSLAAWGGASCRSATKQTLKLGVLRPWHADTVLVAGSTTGQLLGPIQVVRWGGDTLLLSDAVTNRLFFVDVHSWKTTLVLDHYFRPAAPAQLARVGRSEMLVGIYPAELDQVDISNGTLVRIQVPLSGWGERRVGAFALGPDGNVVMIPWSAGRLWATLASTDTATTGFVQFAPKDGHVVRRFGRPISGHSSRRGASLEHLSKIAGWRGDSMVVANLYDGAIDLYLPGDTAPARRFSLPMGFLPQPTVEPVPPNRTVHAQFQLRDAVILGERLLVLRNLDYHWTHRNPLLHVPGAWIAMPALELYTFDGHRVSGTPLPATSDPRGIVPTGTSHEVYVFSAGTGDDPKFPILIRFTIPDAL